MPLLCTCHFVADQWLLYNNRKYPVWFSLQNFGISLLRAGNRNEIIWWLLLEHFDIFRSELLATMHQLVEPRRNRHNAFINPWECGGIGPRVRELRTYIPGAVMVSWKFWTYLTFRHHLHSEESRRFLMKQLDHYRKGSL